jgi:putative zinc finger protein
MTHLSARELELYVIDALPAESARAVEQHVSGCADCAAALAAEARLEHALSEVARQPRTPRRWRIAAASLAAAAAVVIALVATRHAPEPVAALPSCEAAPSAACEQSAHGHGLALVTSAGLDIPRYEMLSPGTNEMGTP